VLRVLGCSPDQHTVAGHGPVAERTAIREHIAAKFAAFGKYLDDNEYNPNRWAELRSGLP